MSGKIILTTNLIEITYIQRSHFYKIQENKKIHLQFLSNVLKFENNSHFIWNK
jgi:hypothetical protein